MMDYYYALKRKELLITFYNMDAPWGHDAKWNKTQKDKCYITQLTVWATREVHKVSRVVKFTEADSGLVFAMDWYLPWPGWMEDGELVFNGNRFSAGETEKVLEVDGGYGCMTV